jgi:hypothetical protein
MSRPIFEQSPKVNIKFVPVHTIEGRDSSVGIATRYGLDGPGIESRWRRNFSHPSRAALETNPASYTLGTGYFPAVKRPGRGAVHPPHLSAEGMER